MDAVSTFDNLKYIAGVAACLSFVASIVLIFSSCILKDFYKHLANRLIVYLTLCHTISSLSYMIHLFAGDLDLYVDWLCTIEAFIMVTFEMSSVFWSSSICAHLVLSILFPKKRTQKLEILYHLVNWGYPIFWSIILLIFDRFSYAGGWCFLQYDNDLLSWRFFTFLPLYMLLFFNISSLVGNLIALRIALKRVKLKILFENAERRREFRVLMRLSLFIIIFFICWIPTFANRLTELFDYRIPALQYIQAVVNPLQGFLNFIVYALTMRFFPRYLDLIVHTKCCKLLTRRMKRKKNSTKKEEEEEKVVLHTRSISTTQQQQLVFPKMKKRRHFFCFLDRILFFLCCFTSTSNYQDTLTVVVDSSDDEKEIQHSTQKEETGVVFSSDSSHPTNALHTSISHNNNNTKKNTEMLIDDLESESHTSYHTAHSNLVNNYSSSLPTRIHFGNKSIFDKALLANHVSDTESETASHVQPYTHLPLRIEEEEEEDRLSISKTDKTSDLTHINDPLLLQHGLLFMNSPSFRKHETNSSQIHHQRRGSEYSLTEDASLYDATKPATLNFSNQMLLQQQQQQHNTNNSLDISTSRQHGIYNAYEDEEEDF